MVKDKTKSRLQKGETLRTGRITMTVLFSLLPYTIVTITNVKSRTHTHTQCIYGVQESGGCEEINETRIAKR